MANWMNRPNKIHSLEGESLYAVCGKQVKGMKQVTQKVNGELRIRKGMGKLLSYISSTQFSDVALTLRCNNCSKKSGLSYDYKTAKEREIDALRMGRGYIV